MVYLDVWMQVLSINRRFVCVSMHIYVLVGRCFSVPVCICKCISVYQSRSLLTPHTVSSLTGQPEAESNERISIWQKWILDCALTDGWIRTDRASLQQDLRCWLKKCLRRGRSGKSGWVSAGERAAAPHIEYRPLNYRKSPHDIIIWSHGSSKHVAWH